MALVPIPEGLKATLDADGVDVILRSHKLRITEWSIAVFDRGLFSTTERALIPLGELKGVRVAPSTMDANWWALVLESREENLVIGAGVARERLMWVLAAIQEAENTRARREGAVGREYLFQQVVPDEVKDLIDR